jgi:hypothetical protein
VKALGAFLIALSVCGAVSGCGGSGSEESPAVAAFVGRYCRYAATSQEQASNCVGRFDSASSPHQAVEEELRGPNAQAVLYALGDVRTCRSQAGPLCEPASWGRLDRGGEDVIARYCAYGASSRARLKECADHAGLTAIEASDTNAARFARGDLTACLEDAGRFCADLTRRAEPESALRSP